MKYNGNINDRMDPYAYEVFTASWLHNASNALSDRGSIWVIGPDILAEIVNRVALGSRLTRRQWCFWHFRFGQHTDAKFIRSHIHLIQLSRSLTPLWNPDEVLVPSDRAAIYNDKRTLHKTKGKPGERVPFSVFCIPRIVGNSAERCPAVPNQLPEQLLEPIILSSTLPGSLVVDPFMGSGSSGVVSLRHGRRWVGMDIDPTLHPITSSHITRRLASA